MDFSATRVDSDGTAVAIVPPDVATPEPSAVAIVPPESTVVATSL